MKSKTKSRRKKSSPTISPWLQVPFFLGCMLTLASTPSVYNAWRIALNADKYQPGIYVIKSVFYQSGGRTASIEAKGSIGGKTEKLSLASFGAKSRNTEALNREFPPGTRLDVLYDPSAADIWTQGAYLCFLPGNYNLKAAKSAAVKRTISMNFLTLVFGAIICGRTLLRRIATSDEKSRTAALR